jgi:hypothetical protein
MAEADAGTAGALAPGVAAALQRLESLDGLPASAHVAAFEQVQRSLDDALADIDGQSGSDEPAQPLPPHPQPARRAQSAQPPGPPQPARQPRPHPPRPGAPGSAPR